MSDIDAANRTGVAAYAYLGFAVAIAPDTNGDGDDELLMGAQGAGKVYIEFGPVSGTSAVTSADATDTSSGSQLGYSVSGAGDMNRDGYDDVIVGAVASEMATIYLGGSSGALKGSSYDLSGSGEAGTSVNAAGDVDNDGYDDVLVGAPSWETGGKQYGAAYLVYGPVKSALDLDTDADIFRGGAADDRAGYSLSGGGDVNADGSPDFLIGAPAQDSGGSAAGAAYLFLGL